MRKPSEVIINGKALEEILENHHHWLIADIEGWEFMQANLSGANLRNADLRGADLRGANLSGADLRNADLRGADLRGSDFRGADLCGADLSYANLRNADFRGADLCYAINVPYIPLECPSDGPFIGWKIVDNVLIKLEIPADAKRSSATTNKCRCDKAKVLGFYDLNSVELNIDKIINHRYNICEYIKGEMVYPDSFDEDRWNECSHGIHFFINKQDAINYGH